MILQKKIYFNNLNGIRFIAALFVIIHHIEQIKTYFELKNIWTNPFIQTIGKQGVILFFVLSGFLITYLLLSEEQLTKKISIKNFYIRRILRIWPLYFLIISLSFFILPNIDFFKFSIFHFDEFSIKYRIFLLGMFLFFLPNLVLAGFSIIPYAAQSWSIGTEEQFYLIWPLLIKKARNKFLLMLYVILIYLFIKLGLSYVSNHLFLNDVVHVFSNFWEMFSIDSMAIGGVAACLIYYKKENILKVLFNPIFQTMIYIALFILLISGYFIIHFHNEVYSVLFAIIILNLAENKKSILNIENKIFNYLGRISYGLYMYHGIAIVIAIKLLLKLEIYNNVIMYLFSIILTIIISAISFHFYENKFIKLKLKYSNIIK